MDAVQKFDDFHVSSKTDKDQKMEKVEEKDKTVHTDKQTTKGENTEVKDVDVGKSEKTDKDQKMETVEEKDKTVHTDKQTTKGEHRSCGQSQRPGCR